MQRAHLYVNGPGVLQLECLVAAFLGTGEGTLSGVNSLVVVDVIFKPNIKRKCVYENPSNQPFRFVISHSANYSSK